MLLRGDFEKGFEPGPTPMPADTVCVAPCQKHDITCLSLSIRH